MLSKAVSGFFIIVLMLFVINHPDALVDIAQAVINSARRVSDALVDLNPVGDPKGKTS